MHERATRTPLCRLDKSVAGDRAALPTASARRRRTAQMAQGMGGDSA